MLAEKLTTATTAAPQPLLKPASMVDFIEYQLTRITKQND